eukprot:TRINITY_DN65359_c0_g1_i1.p1 TRINITY_DN65359_c0_g1~~TRINITY_DN65359_c0_g1_i1.p1  ORF type:complete len:667 (+),score=177.68 TRINITY_DN65359_c0_g1_i1:87-2003(+)
MNPAHAVHRQLFRTILRRLRQLDAAAAAVAGVTGQDASAILRRYLRPPVRVALPALEEQVTSTEEAAAALQGEWYADYGMHGVEELTLHTAPTPAEALAAAAAAGPPPAAWPLHTEAAAALMPSAIIASAQFSRKLDMYDDEFEQQMAARQAEILSNPEYQTGDGGPLQDVESKLRRHAETYSAKMREHSRQFKARFNELWEPGGLQDADAPYSLRCEAAALELDPGDMASDAGGGEAAAYVLAVKRGLGDCFVPGGQCTFSGRLLAPAATDGAAADSGATPAGPQGAEQPILQGSIRVAGACYRSRNNAAAEGPVLSNYRIGALDCASNNALGWSGITRDFDCSGGPAERRARMVAAARRAARRGEPTAAALQLGFEVLRQLQAAVTGLTAWAAAEPQRRATLDAQFAVLAAALPAERAAAEERIWKVWRSHGDTRLNRMLEEAAHHLQWAAAEEHQQRVLSFADQVLALDPTCAEAWNIKAIARYLWLRQLTDRQQKEGKQQSLSHEWDWAVWLCAAALCHEPRHFGALSGAAAIHQQHRHDLAAELSTLKSLQRLQPSDRGLARRIRSLRASLRQAAQEAAEKEAATKAEAASEAARDARAAAQGEVAAGEACNAKSEAQETGAGAADSPVAAAA